MLQKRIHVKNIQCTRLLIINLIKLSIILTGNIISRILFDTTGTCTQYGLGGELRKYSHYICYICKYMLVNITRYWGPCMHCLIDTRFIWPPGVINWDKH